MQKRVLLVENQYRTGWWIVHDASTFFVKLYDVLGERKTEGNIIKINNQCSAHRKIPYTFSKYPFKNILQSKFQSSC